MSDQLELKTIQGATNNNNVANTDVSIEVTPGNGACHEVSPLLSAPQVTEAKRGQPGEAVVSNESENIPRWQEELQKVKRELNEVLVWKLKVWMVILIILCLIALIIAVSAVIVCTADYDDEDEKFDRSSFVVKRFFRGNFTLVNNSFTSHPVTQPEDPEKLLENQLTAVYNSSLALARYFSKVTINIIRDSTAEFELQFIAPSENPQLVRFTLSREMVKNVLLQHFYDQDRDAGDTYYVIPASLSMEVGPMGKI